MEPWTATASRNQGGSWIVELIHEASNGLVIETDTSDEVVAAGRVLDALAGSREVERVGRAPRLDHPDVIVSLRAIVQSFGWSRTEVRAVAGLLQQVKALDPDETQWFESSFGEDRPPPRATTIL